LNLVDEMGFEPTTSSLRTRKNPRKGTVRQSLSLSRGLSSWTTWTTGLFAFFIFSALCVAEFFALPFRRAQDQGRELAGATEFERGHHRSAGGQGSAEYPERERKKIGIGVTRLRREE
jgi:hypothetical protein